MRRTRASDLVRSESAVAKAKVSSTANNTNKSTNNNSTPPTSSSALSNDDSKGSNNHRLGTYRPCVRCRVKKTKCDKSRPSCSSCVKGGVEATCVYDMDETASAEEHSDEDALHSVASSTAVPSTIVGTTTSIAPSPSGVEIESERLERQGRKPSTLPRTTTATTSKLANGHATRSSTNSSGNAHNNSHSNSGRPTLQQGKAEPISTATKKPDHLESPRKGSKIAADDLTSRPSALEQHEAKARHDEAFVDIESNGKLQYENCIFANGSGQYC